jgi:acyl dehydratase
MACVLGSPGFWWRDARTSVDWLKIVHGEQRLEVFRPLPVAGTLVAKNRVVSVSDKGVGRGALALIERDIYEQGHDALLARAAQLVFLRGDGGFSRTSGFSDAVPPPLPGVPQRSPDMEMQVKTLPQAALIYRLSGDYNPLHADPRIAAAARYSRPILHGLCTFGMAMHAVLRVCCEYDVAQVRAMAVRFAAPVYPGEALRFELWRGEAGKIYVRARSDARGVVVLDRGTVTLGSQA